MSADTSLEEPGREEIESLYAGVVNLLVSYQKYVMLWQREVLRVGFTEISLFQSGVLTAMRAAVQEPDAERADREAIRRFVGPADMWLRLAVELQSALLRAFAPPTAVPDRRTKSIVINFPERRAA